MSAQKLIPLRKAVPFAYEEAPRPQENLRFTVAAWGALLTLCLTALLYGAATKSVVIANASPETYLAPAGGQELILSGGFALEIRTLDRGGAGAAGSEGGVVVPLESGMRAERISVENRESKRILLIRLSGASAEFYRGNAIFAGGSFFSGGVCGVSGEDVLLILQMNRVYECSAIVSGSENRLEIRLSLPRETYPFLAVLDAEDETAAQVARLAKEKLSSEGIGVYLTGAAAGVDGEDWTEEELEEFLTEVGADAFVRVATAEDADASMYGIRVGYNGRYYLPGYGNSSLAEELLREIVRSSSNRARGAEDLSEDGIFAHLSIPAAQVEIGFRTNEAEGVLLSREEYREKLAEGLAAALRSTGEELGR